MLRPGQRGPADALQQRRDGIWPAEGGGLIVHAGDRIWTHPEGREYRPGWVEGGAIHVAAPSRFGAAQIRVLREGTPATAAECAALVERFRLWEFAAAQERAAPPLLAGTVAVGIYAGALTRWRPHTWLRGPSNAGKSTLSDFVVAAAGADPRSKDVSEAYIRHAFNGRAGLIALDEQEPDLAGVTAVLRLMRGASDGEGGRTGRVHDGAAATFRVSCAFLLAAISTPAFEPADASRRPPETLNFGRRDDRAVCGQPLCDGTTGITLWRTAGAALMSARPAASGPTPAQPCC